ncbi:hypothetical protein CANMA_001467 [Candida margitis]|uniref:uncharacterized protein n=1 Tax=Candida margitis TaxID=1775924 RepID=UPI0022267FB8|nr:uncharacterized protein CANMA_001467 [Candida margitis]KAI5969400.1 hypothetical protein CANMA_001467 [Candida margitis]
MSGSSRFLVRALEAVFAEKEISKHADSHLNTTIKDYFAKHNNFTTIKQSSYNIHEELYRLYNGYVKPSHQLEQENKFLGVLTQLCDVFNELEMNLWISTYLKSAIDSAAYDINFVTNSRKFIEKALTSYSSTECDRLNDLHARISSSLAQLLMDIYLNEETLREKLKLNMTKEQNESQAYHERIRFIRSNCSKLLLDYGLKHTTEYCNLLNQYLQNVDFRLEILVLLGYFVGKDINDASRIVENGLFQSLLKCILFDLDPTIIHCALNDLFILMPKAATVLGNHLSDLFLVYIRITNWDETPQASPAATSLADIFASDLGSWKVASHKSTETDIEVAFNYQYLCTLFYGLFYFNFAAFIYDPLDYVTNHTPLLISLKSLKQLNSSSSGKISPISRAMTITKSLIRAFLVHPKYWMTNDLADELIHPANWLPSNAPSEEIAVACLILNPSIFSMRNDEANTSTPSFNAASTVGDALSRSSSLAGPMYFQANGPTKQLLKSRLLQHRKLSITPAHLVSDNNTVSHGQEDEVKFKEFGFSGGQDQPVSDTSGPTSPSSSKQERHEPADDLLYDHERLFTTVKHNKLYHQNSAVGGHGVLDPLTTVSDPSNEKTKQKMRLGRPMSSPTTNLETSSVFKDNSTATTIGSSGDTNTLHSSTNVPSQFSLNELNGSGTIIDFYQRELLLFKNELEFSSYMTNLNKFHYLKTKNEISEGSGGVSGNSLLQEEASELSRAINGLKDEWGAKQQEYHCQYDFLTTKIEQLEMEKNKLSEQLSELRQSTESSSKDYDELVKNTIPNKNYEIEQLKLKLNTSDQQLQEQQRNTIDNEADTSFFPSKELKSTQKSLEDQIYNYKMENQVFNQQIGQLEQENKDLQIRYNSIIAQYETKLEKAKLSLSETLTSLTDPYEKKITELQAVIHKYQTLLEEQTRNKMVPAPSSGTVPIPIIRQNSSSSSDNYSYGHDGNNNGNTIPSRSVAPIQHMVRNGSSSNSGKAGNGSNNPTGGDSLPLMRGRGGLQKRTRKLM